MSPLAWLNEGETGEIVGFKGHFGNGPCGRKDHLAGMGLRPGQRIEMVANQGGGPLVVRIDESRLALGRGIAMKIYIRRIES